MGCTALVPKVPAIPVRLTAADDFEDLQEWMLSRETLNRPLHEVEQGQLERSREVNRKLLQEHIDGRGDGNSGLKLTVLRPAEEPLTLDRGRVRDRQI